MALKLGELSVLLRVDDKEFDRRLDRAKREFKGFGSGLKKAAAAAGVAAALALSVGFVSALNVDKANDKLAAQLGSSAVEAKRFGGIAGDLYADAFGNSMGEVNTALKGVVQHVEGMRGASKEALKDVTGDVLALAETFELDLGQTTRAVGKLVKTGMASDASQALDLLTRGFQTGTDEAGDLLDTVSEYSTQFRELGIDGKKAFGLISQGLSAGARDADTVADAIKEFAIRSKDGSSASRQAFRAIGLDAGAMFDVFARGGPDADQAMADVIGRLKAMKDPVAQDAAAVALFGTKAEDLQDALFALDPTSAVDALGQVEGATDAMANTMRDNAATTLEQFKRQAKAALVERLAAAVPHLQAVAKWMGENKAIVEPLIGILAGLTTVITAIIVVTKIWTAVQTAWGIVMAISLGPITLIILGIMLVVGVIILIATKTDWFQRLWGAAWGGIKGAASAVWDWLKDTAWPGMKKFFLDLASLMTWPLRTAIDWVGKLIGWFKAFPGRAKSAFARLGEIIFAPFRWAFNKISSFWNNGPGQLSLNAPGWVPGIGGKSFSLPKLPLLAAGGRALQAGLAIVGDAGPEVLHLPRGAVVEPLGHGGAAGGHLTLDLIIRDEDGLVRTRKTTRVQGGQPRTVLVGA